MNDDDKRKADEAINEWLKESAKQSLLPELEREARKELLTPWIWFCYGFLFYAALDLLAV